MLREVAGLVVRLAERMFRKDRRALFFVLFANHRAGDREQDIGPGNAIVLDRPQLIGGQLAEDRREIAARHQGAGGALRIEEPALGGRDGHVDDHPDHCAEIVDIDMPGQVQRRADPGLVRLHPFRDGPIGGAAFGERVPYGDVGVLGHQRVDPPERLARAHPAQSVQRQPDACLNLRHAAPRSRPDIDAGRRTRIAVRIALLNGVPLRGDRGQDLLRLLASARRDVVDRLGAEFEVEDAARIPRRPFLLGFAVVLLHRMMVRGQGDLVDRGVPARPRPQDLALDGRSVGGRGDADIADLHLIADRALDDRWPGDALDRRESARFEPGSGRPGSRGPDAHGVGFALEPGIVVDRGAAEPHRRAHAALLLLDDVPGLMRQVAFLAGAEVDLAALGMGERPELGRSGRIAVDAHIVERDARERFHAALQPVRKAGAVGPGSGTRHAKGMRCGIVGDGFPRCRDVRGSAPAPRRRGALHGGRASGVRPAARPARRVDGPMPERRLHRPPSSAPGVAGCRRARFPGRAAPCHRRRAARGRAT